MTVSKLKKKLDEVFSRYIRYKYAKDGYVSCYTCGTTEPIKEMQCGHYITRGKLATRWDEDNCRVQCVACNIFKKGNYQEYSRRLINEMGCDIIETLTQKSHQTLKLKAVDYQELIDLYTEKLKNVNN